MSGGGFGRRRVARRGASAVLALGWLVVDAGSGQALPVAKPELAGGRLVLVQAAGPEATERAPFAELNEALTAARAKLEELTSAAELATLAGDLRQQLEAAQSENARLRDQLQQARAAVERAAAGERAAQAEVAARQRALDEYVAKDAALVDAAERSAAEAARLRREVEELEKDVASAIAAQHEAEGRLIEAQDVVQDALEEAARLGEELDLAQKELASSGGALVRTRRERDAAREAVERLEEELAIAESRIEALVVEAAAMEEELGELRLAASSATEVARENLLAVESKIRVLNAALADIRPEAGEQPAEANGPEADVNPVISSAAAAPLSGARLEQVPLPPPIDAGAVREAALAPEPAEERESDAWDGLATPGPGTQPVRTLAELTAALPPESRVQVRNLLADLKAETSDAGFVVTVPGEILFALNSERIEPSAHDMLARVAELIDIYDDRAIVITGHTDAMGDASYNLDLSVRRAELVKSFFVDNFAIEPVRLATRGRGEEEPIASNATLAGRQTNRRVEIVILN
jgi:outer membrane protein OmpA-like peptidoglycan-associated protein/predicted  nucleic acid-binding Zn-ribbon protein